ncbi:hypothetical protein D3C75_621170 [compost metagenome]
MAHEGVGSQCQRFGIWGAVDHEQREQEVIPDPHYVDNDNGCCDRFQQWEDDTEEQAEAGCSINRGTLINFNRNTLDESMVDKHGEWSTETPI